MIKKQINIRYERIEKKSKTGQKRGLLFLVGSDEDRFLQ